MPLIVQKYGGTSVADPDRMRAVAENVAFTRRHGNDVVVVVSAMGKSTDNLIALAVAGVASPAPAARWTCCSPPASASPAALLTMALARPRRRRRQLHRQPGRHHHRHRPRQGEDRRGQGRPRPPGARRRQGRRGRRLPGREHRQGDHHDGPRRLRPHRLGAGRGARAPMPARSTPTSPACSRPTRGSCRRPAS